MLQANKLSVSDVQNCRMTGDLYRARALASTYCLENENDAVGWYEAGLIERLSNNLPQAVKYHAAALKINPNFFGAVLDLGICRREMADYPAAIAALSAASRIDATHFAPSYYLGMIYLSLRDLKHAINYFSQALAVEPNSIDALFMAGLCARYDRNYDGADKFFRKVLKIQPDHLMAKGLIGQATVLKQLEVITDQILESKVLDVKRGPFKGLHYIRPTVTDNLYFNLAQKLAGLHECELWLAFDYLLRQNYSTVINIGCAEGFYAVGFALRFPSASILAYDIEPLEREHCVEMATLNGVVDRIKISGRCGQSELNEAVVGNSLVICDIEGGEKELLDPGCVPNLKKTTLLVELHDLYDPTITPTIINRFQNTHEICLIGSVDKSPARFDGVLSGITLEMLRVIEGRDAPMHWALMVPLGSDAVLV